MGKSSELFMEVRIKAEMSEETFKNIPEEVRDEMKIKAIEASNFKEAYREDKHWIKINKRIALVIKARSMREDEIRTEHKIK